MVTHLEIAGAVPGDVGVVNLEDFGEEADLPHVCFPIAGLQYYDYDKVDDLIGRIRPERGDRLLI